MPVKDHVYTEARAQAILDNARDAIVTIDRSGAIIDFNNEATRMFGFQSAEILGQNVSILMPSPYREEHDGHIENFLRTGEKKAIGRVRHVQAVRSNGEQFPIELSVAEVQTGRQDYFAAIIRDVTTITSAIAAVERERDFTTTLIDLTPNVILVTDTDGAVTMSNRFAQELSGFSSDEISRFNLCREFISAPDRDSFAKLSASVLEGTGVRNCVTRLVTKTSEEKWIRWYGEPVRDAGGDVTGALWGGEDITAERQAADQMARLEQRAKEKERLADLGVISSKIVHDLGNPVAGISMHAQLLSRRLERLDSPKAAELGESADLIVDTCKRLTDLVRQFLQFTREQHLTFEETDLSQLLADVVQFWRPAVAAQGSALELVLPETGSPAIIADDSQLRRVFGNLINNAAEAMADQPGTCRIEVLPTDNGAITVEVGDEGPGVQSGIEIFRMFETSKPNGSGLGLAISKQIVVAHGGVIDFRNRDEGGAVFSIELPLEGPRSGKYHV